MISSSEENQDPTKRLRSGVEKLLVSFSVWTLPEAERLFKKNGEGESTRQIFTVGKLEVTMWIGNFFTKYCYM